MGTRLFLLVLVLVLIALTYGWLGRKTSEPSVSVLPPVPESQSLSVFHLGHSLVGRDMPAMLAQLAGKGHHYDSQLGWGTSLRQHWDPAQPIAGFESENAHSRFRPARNAIGSGDYDAIVLTEMVELRDAIRYHNSARYLRKWTDLAKAGSGDAQIYLYETWHRLDDPDGWLARLDNDHQALWLDELLVPAQRATQSPIRLIPAGQVMAAFVRKIEATENSPIQSRTDLFGRTQDGELDPIHLNDFGAYLVALTHYAVLYRRSPVGLPHRLLRADGTLAKDPGPETALLMQETVWDIVSQTPLTGVGS